MPSDLTALRRDLRSAIDQFTHEGPTTRMSPQYLAILLERAERALPAEAPKDEALDALERALLDGARCLPMTQSPPRQERPCHALRPAYRYSWCQGCVDTQAAAAIRALRAERDTLRNAGQCDLTTRLPEDPRDA